MCAYALGNTAGPFIWRKKYFPRNHIPWAILTTCSFLSGVLILVLRFMLASENKRRDKEMYDDKYDNVFVMVDGAEKKVDKVRHLFC